MSAQPKVAQQDPFEGIALGKRQTDTGSEVTWGQTPLVDGQPQTAGTTFGVDRFDERGRLVGTFENVDPSSARAMQGNAPEQIANRERARLRSQAAPTPAPAGDPFAEIGDIIGKSVSEKQAGERRKRQAVAITRVG